MPRICEVYGKKLDWGDPKPMPTPISDACPFTGASCDGGGNRHQTAISLADSPPLAAAYGRESGRVLPAVCSISYGDADASGDRWIVCPHRVIGAGAAAPGRNVPPHEAEILRSAGVPAGIDVGIWSEVHLRDGSDDGDQVHVVNYHFDFVVCPIRKATLRELSREYNVDAESLLARARRSLSVIPARLRQDTPLLAPDLTSPVIIEVMTARTSGSNKEVGTNVAAAFGAALMGKRSSCPGINRRQVWGRMATQLYAKSCIASSWGGRTTWVLQDVLLAEMASATGFRPNDTKPPASGVPVNFCIVGYGDRGDEGLRVKESRSWDAGIGLGPSRTMTDLLRPSSLPSKGRLLEALLGSPPVERLRL